MILHAIHNLELSLTNPSLDVDVLVVIRRIRTYSAIQASLDELGNIQKSVNFNPFSLCLVKNVASFPRFHAAIAY